MPDSGIANGATFTSSFWDTYARQQVVAQVTSATRPTNIEGRLIYETDTDRVLLGDGSNWVVMAEPIQTYTPTFANCASGTAAGYYKRSDGWIDVWASYTMAGAGVSGAVTVSLPKTMAGATRSLGSARLIQAGVANTLGHIPDSSTTVMTVSAINCASTYAGTEALSSTVPFTWAVNDRIEVATRYQMANRYD